jgi:hypothetical protein
MSTEFTFPSDLGTSLAVYVERISERYILVFSAAYCIATNNKVFKELI